MLSFGNKDFRNLQEQVLKNMSDIQDMMQGVNVLADFGIKVVGQVDSAAELPDPSEYEGDYGDAYVVGESEPYDYYIFTRAFEGEEEPQWFDLGQFPVPGPQGETGPQGEIGETPNVTMEIGSVSTLLPTQSATASIVKSGTLENPVFTLNLAIPEGFRGAMGLTGPQGPRGPQGPQGEQGPRGEQGGLIEIVGIVAAASALPSPATLQKLDAAYLVGTSPDYELYVQVGESPSTALWTNLGAINEGTVVTVNGEPQTVWEASGKFVPIYDGQLVDTLYGQAAGTGNGQTHVPYGNTATANYIVQRDINSQITVPETPTANGHAASKKYVDDSVAGALPVEYAGDLIIGTSTAHQGTRLAIGSANQLLGVNSSGNGLEYKTINSVPAYSSTDADKILKVDSLGTGLEWGSASGGGDILWTNIENTASATNKNLLIGDKQFGKKITSSNIKDNIFLKSGDRDTNTGTFAINSSYNWSQNVFLDNFPGNSPLYVTCQRCIVTRPKEAFNSFLSSNAQGYYKDSLILCAGDNMAKISSIKSSILIIPELYSNYDIGNSIVDATGSILSVYSINTGSGPTGTRYISHSIILGEKNVISSPFYNRLMIGSYGTYSSSNSTDILIVGAGSSTSSPANCFAAGKDSTNGNYIKIGNTQLTETQLAALLATI